MTFFKSCYFLLYEIVSYSSKMPRKDYESEGRAFESLRDHQSIQHLQPSNGWLFCFVATIWQPYGSRGTSPFESLKNNSPDVRMRIRTLGSSHSGTVRLVMMLTAPSNRPSIQPSSIRAYNGHAYVLTPVIYTCLQPSSIRVRNCQPSSVEA